jgi:hypothetical protein
MEVAGLYTQMMRLRSQALEALAGAVAIPVMILSLFQTYQGITAVMDWISLGYNLVIRGLDSFLDPVKLAICLETSLSH